MLSSTKSRFAGKNFSLLFIAFLLMQFTSLAQPGWFWQNPKPQGNTLNDVWAFDENNFIAVGNAGVIINSSDGGVNWTQYFIGMSNNLISILQFIFWMKIMAGLSVAGIQALIPM